VITRELNSKETSHIKSTLGEDGDRLAHAHVVAFGGAKLGPPTSLFTHREPLADSTIQSPTAGKYANASLTFSILWYTLGNST
jgi:hypothetical protein